jgi:MFS family permease
VAIALPHIGADLGLSRGTLTWVVSAYTLMFGGLMLLGGRAADLLGGRVAQGVGAAMLSPAALSVVTKTFHGEERNKALGIWSALGGGGGSAIGVLLGGVLTAGPGWQWVFYVNVPIGLIVLAVLSRTLPADLAHGQRARLDVPGAVLVTAGTGTRSTR